MKSVMIIHKHALISKIRKYVKWYLIRKSRWYVMNSILDWLEVIFNVLLNINVKEKEINPEYSSRAPYNLMQLFCYVTNVVGV